MDKKVTFRVGQVWRNKKDYPGILFTITSVANGAASALKSDTKKVNVLTYLESGATARLNDQWELLDDPGNKNEWRDWRNNRPGECACGILKSLCVYHK